jgi:hypothetical protein
MATAKYTALAEITLSSTDSEIVFASIPAGYRDLFLVGNYGASSSGFAGKAYLNSDTTSGNYTSVRMVGNGSTTESNSNGGSIRWEVQATANSQVKLEILDYSQTDKHKTVLVRADNAGAATEASASRWASTSAVTSVTLAFGTTFTSGSTFCLYGVK